MARLTIAGAIVRSLKELYGERVVATELHNPDFVTLAESFGAVGVNVEPPSAPHDAVAGAWGRARPTLVRVAVGRFSGPFDTVLPTTAVRGR